MAQKKKASDTSEEDKNKKEDESTDEETDEVETEDEDDSEDKGSDEDDLDEELEIEKKRGKPDQNKAKVAFKERKAKKVEDSQDEDEDETEDDDDNKPITRAEARKQREEDRRIMLEGQALSTARGFGVSEKKAQLIVAVWKNRGFPADMSLPDQMDEAYAIANRKTLVSERNEAMRAARNKGGITEVAAESHRDSQRTGEPKLPEGEKRALAAAGFVYDGSKRMYKKSLREGKLFLYRDPKTGKTFTSVA